METRLERNKRRRKERTINRLKRFCILIWVILFLFGINIVNRTYFELNNWPRSRYLSYNPERQELNILGKTYIIDLSFIKIN